MDVLMPPTATEQLLNDPVHTPLEKHRSQVRECLCRGLGSTATEQLPNDLSSTQIETHSRLAHADPRPVRPTATELRQAVRLDTRDEMLHLYWRGGPLFPAMTVATLWLPVYCRLGMRSRKLQSLPLPLSQAGNARRFIGNVNTCMFLVRFIKRSEALPHTH